MNVVWCKIFGGGAVSAVTYPHCETRADENLIGANMNKVMRILSVIIPALLAACFASPAWAATCASAKNSTAVANPTSVIADGITTSTITVRVMKGGAGQNGVTVTLTAGSGSSTITPLASAPLTASSATTAGGGYATFTVKDLVVQSVTYTAVASKAGCTTVTISQKPIVNFVRAAPTVAKSFTPATIAANATSTLTITLTNGNTSNITGATFTDTYPANLKNAGTPAVSTTCAGGTATAVAGGGSLTLSGGTIPASGSCTVTVTVTSATAGSYLNSTGAVTSTNALVGTAATATLTVTAISAANSTVVASPTTVLANGVATSTITVTLRDGANLAVSGKTVTLTKSGGSSTISAASGPSDINGVVTFTVKDTVAETTTYTAQDTTDTITVTQTATVTFVKVPIFKSFSTSPIAINGTSTLTVTLTNATGAIVSGAGFTDTYPAGLVNASNPSASGCGAGVLSGTNGGNTLGMTGATIAANSACVVSVSVTAATAGTYTNTATNTALATSTASLVVTGISAANSTVSASPASVAANGISTSTITVTLKDGAGNPVPGKTVTLAKSSGSSVITLVSNAAGVATFTVTDIVAEGPIIYTATDTTDSITVTQTASVTFTLITAPTVAKSFNPTTIADYGTTTLNITLTNPNAAAITGVAFTDTYPATGGLANTSSLVLSNTCGGTNPGTSANGTTLTLSGGTIPASSSCSVSVQVTAAFPGATPSSPIVNSTGAVTSSNAISGTAASATLTVVNVSAANSTVVASPTAVPSDNTTTSTITVTLKDGAGNPVSGTNVSLAASGGSSTITVVSATTDVSGIATFTVKDAVVESVTYTATDMSDTPNVVITQTALVTFKPVTTLAPGTDPAATTIAPGTAATDVDLFTLQTSGGSEAITSVTVNLSTSSGVGRLSITNNAGTELGFTTSPVTGSNTITVAGMSATTTLTTFKVRITPLSHAAMPLPPGAAYAITAPVTTWAGPYTHAGSDTNTNALTIDNLSPTGATATSGSAGGAQVTLNWTTSASADFSRSVVLRWTGGAAGAEVPAEGTDYVNGNTITTTTVVCVRTADAASTAVSGVDGAGTGGCSATALISGQAYTYKIFQKDSNGNYDVGVAMGTFTTLIPSALAEYRMDEANWNGTANEVVDSSASYPGTAGYTATPPAATTATTAFVSDPAYTSGAQSTCRYGQFDTAVKTGTYVDLKSTFPKLGSNYTVTAWIRSSNVGTAGQRIFANDDANLGWFISLGDGGSGKLRVLNRTAVNSGVPTAGGVNPACGAFCLDTSAAVIINNAWYFVAMAVDTANKQVSLYAYDSTLTQKVATSTAYIGAWGTDPGATSVGGETFASAEYATTHFFGNIDEVRVYQNVLSQAALAAIAAQTRVCPINVPDHLEIQSSGSGLTCAASTLTAVACQDATCAKPFTLGVSGTLSAAGAPTVNWDGTTGGVAGAGFVIPNGSSSVTKDVQVATAGTVVFGVSSATPTPTNATACNFGSPACTFTASTAGFIFSDSVSGNTTYTIPVLTSGTAQNTNNLLWLRAVQASTANAAVCTPAIISQTVTVNMGYACNNPNTCQAGNLGVINGTAIAPAGTGVSLAFDANGSAKITSVRYDDVGQITLTANKTVTPFGGATAVTLNGNSNTFVVKPDHFDLSGIKCSTIDAANCGAGALAMATSGDNPAAADAAGVTFIRAGHPFTVTVTAKNALGGITKNYGQETATESVKLTPALVAGFGLTNNPAISGTFGAFSNGVATGTAFAWNEVGIIKLTPGILSGNYLSVAGDTTGTQTGNVGRFYAAKFALSGGVIANRTDIAACVASGCGSFTYMGERFDAQFMLTAQAVGGAPTQNYNYSATAANNFAKLNPASAGNPLVFGAVDSTAPAYLTSRLDTSLSATGNFVNGTANVVAPLAIGRGGAPDGPYALLDIGIAPVDGDGALMAAYDLDTDAIAGNDHTKVARTEVRYGRMKLPNAHGSELLPLPTGVMVQYWNGTSYVTNTTDSTTSFAIGAIVPTIVKGPLTVGNIVSAVVGDACAANVFCNGVKKINLSSSAKQTGSADICLNSPAYLQGTPACASGTPGPNAGRATFGVYKGNNEFIYLRENY